MITISRLLARQLRSVFHRALGRSPHRLDYSLTFSAGSRGLRIFASAGGFAVSYQQPAALPACELTVPMTILREAEGNCSEPITLLLTSDGNVIVRWQDGKIPQERTAPISSEVMPMPPMPASMLEQPASLRQALKDATAVTDATSSRYALGCIQLRGQQGDLSTTDGRQIFRQGGFDFGFEQELLFRPSDVFALKELAAEKEVKLGTTADHVVIALGPWTFWLPIEKEARFPSLDDVILPPERAAATLQLSAADAEFLANSLGRLPGSGGLNQPVTVELNGCVAVRGRSEDNGKITELRLSSSSWSGEKVRLHTNRQFLERAARLGFERLAFFAPESPVVCRDAQRTYVWAALSSHDAIAASDDATVIESAAALPRSRSHSRRPCEQTGAEMITQRKRSASTSSLQPAVPVSPPNANSLSEQVRELKALLQDARRRTGNLAREIRLQGLKRRSSNAVPTRPESRAVA